MKISNNFASEEFLSESFHKKILKKGYNPKWWIDKDLVNFCEWLKIKCGGKSVIVNDWLWGGSYQLSGFREFTDIGSKYSQHKYKAAIDVKVKDYSSAEIADIIKSNFDIVNRNFLITTIEKIEFTPTWTHVDKRWTGLDYLLEVNG